MASPERLSSLAAVGVTREVLQAHGLATKHALGQNFLVNDDIIKKIADLAELTTDDFVLEVGPGIGTLTEALLKSSKNVVSVERDRDLPAVLEETLAEWSDSFALIQKDALELQESDLDTANLTLGLSAGVRPNKFVSNLPYAVAATIILDFFERFSFVDSATVMVQREVGERIMATPGTKNYGAYTVKLSLFAQPVDKFLVSPGNFFPPPHVESMVIRLDRYKPIDAQGNELSPEQRAAACIMADASFTNRRKTISNSCKAYFAGRGDDGMVKALPEIFAECNIAPTRRGETLSQAEFIALGNAYLARKRS